jgi:predicted ABC-class ATPase
VILMRDYLPSNVTDEARRVASAHPTQRRSETSAPLRQVAQRMPIADSFDPSRGRRSVKIDAKSVDLIFFGEDAIELRCVEQLLDRSQTRAVGYAIHRAASAHMDGRLSLREVLDLLEDELDASGLDGLDPFRRGEGHPGNFARPRRYEIAAAINRLRTVRVGRVE